ncbi:hypothetical protein HRbin23_00935 [bacterium HR23]|nr:hypothetical protein HRbin23_00935 [bacterium HR23]
MFGELWVAFFFLLLVGGLAGRAWLLAVLGGVGLATVSISWAWATLALERLTYTRHLSRWRVLAGEETELTVTLANRKPIPVGWARVEDDFPDEIEVIGRELEVSSRPRVKVLAHTTSLKPYERVRWTYRLRCPRRGFYRIGPAILRSGDIFGFFPRFTQVPDEAFLLVFPRPVDLPWPVLLPRRAVGDSRGVEPFHPDPSRFAGIRDYQPGDSPKTVDWKATLRRGRLQVRQYDPGASPLLAVVANIDTVGVVWGGHIPRYLERVVTASASLVSRAYQEGYSIGLYTNGLSVIYERPLMVPPARGPEHLTLLLETLAMAGPHVASPIEEVLLREERSFPAGSTLVLITAIMTAGLREVLDGLARRRKPPLLVWVSDETPEGTPPEVPVLNLGGVLQRLEAGDGCYP